MKRIKFEYRDATSGWQWRKQECVMESVQQAVEIYGLGTDCEYRIVSVEDAE